MYFRNCVTIKVHEKPKKCDSEPQDLAIFDKRVWPRIVHSGLLGGTYIEQRRREVREGLVKFLCLWSPPFESADAGVRARGIANMSSASIAQGPLAAPNPKTPHQISIRVAPASAGYFRQKT